ncbi:hypothetical protein B5F34_02215 [Mediterranea sp. An20]|nr:hypothetical protein B5F34_02215 [Mediterranea sp. An20]
MHTRRLHHPRPQRTGTRRLRLGRHQSHQSQRLIIAQKETNETLYWLKLLYATNFIEKDAYESVNQDALALLKIITASIKTAKQRINH